VETFIPISLPSKCKTYGEIINESLTIRSFKGKDAEIMASVTMKNLFKKFITVLDDTLQGIPANTLTSGDAKFIMLWQAINSYSGTVNINIVCEKCYEEFKQIVNLDKDLSIIELEDDLVLPIPVKLSDGTEISVRLTTLADESALFDWISDGKEGYLYEIALTIVSDKNVLEKIAFLKELPLKDIHLISKVQEDYYHGPDMNIRYFCPSCKYEGKVEVPFRTETLFSFE